LVSWVLAANSVSNGFGFPFDQPHLVFYQRLQQAYPKLKQLKVKGVTTLPLFVLNKTLSDQILKNAQVSIEQRITLFNQLREAMRIACTDSDHGLNDEGDDDIDSIERRVKAFRDDEKLKALSAKDTRYRKLTNKSTNIGRNALPNQSRSIHPQVQSLSNRNEPIISWSRPLDLPLIRQHKSATRSGPLKGLFLYLYH
jgi:hypothetical protein